MVEIRIADYIGKREALGIIGTLFVVLYFSRKQTQSLSIDIETKVLNDLAEKLDSIVHLAIERPNLIRVVSKVDANSPETAYAYDIMFTFAHAFHMRQRKVLSENEWAGWLRWMKSAFQQGELMEIWEKTIEMEKWFDPAFQEFVDKELIPKNKRA
jgi:hypothetical protein